MSEIIITRYYALLHTHTKKYLSFKRLQNILQQNNNYNHYSSYYNAQKQKITRHAYLVIISVFSWVWLVILSITQVTYVQNSSFPVKSHRIYCTTQYCVGSYLPFSTGRKTRQKPPIRSFFFVKISGTFIHHTKLSFGNQKSRYK